MDYVLGFMFSPDFKKVALIRKNKPEWQKGLLNGIGGKLELHEFAPEDAMIREFQEEAGYKTSWTLFSAMGGATNDGEPFSVYCFTTTGDLTQLKSQEEEKIEIIDTETITPLRTDMVENLPWLIPLAIDMLRDNRPYFVDVSYHLN